MQAFQKELENYLASIPDPMSTSASAASQTWVLEQKLHEINERYKKLIRTLVFKGKLVNESLQKHQDFQHKVQKFLPWLSEAERHLSREIHEQIPSDPKRFHKKIENMKVRNKFFVDIKKEEQAMKLNAQNFFLISERMHVTLTRL